MTDRRPAGSLGAGRLSGLPVIETPRLRLRPRRIVDLEACLALDGETGAQPFATAPVPPPLDDPVAHRRFVEAQIRGPYPPGLGCWMVARREAPAEGLGWAALIPEDGGGLQVELRWQVAERWRGRGYAPEAGANLISHGFARAGLRRIVSRIHRDNAAARRVAEKIGMRLRRDDPAGDIVEYGAGIDCAV